MSTNEIISQQTSPEIYIPNGAYTLDKAKYNLQIRLGLQGPPGIGKTYQSLTFPNPCVVSLDRGLVCHQGRKDVIEVPFFDDAFVETIEKRKTPEYIEYGTGLKKIRPVNRKDAILKWFYTQGIQLTSNQTCIVDGSTGLQAAFHRQYWTDPAFDKDGKIKPYEEYNRKLAYFTELIGVCLKGLKSHVIYICHELDDRNSEGEKNGRIRPLMSGAFKDELLSHFTDWFRCHCFDRPTTLEGKKELQKKTGATTELIDEWLALSNPKSEAIYLWQTESDGISICRTSLLNCPKFILADYSSFEKYKRKE